MPSRTTTFAIIAVVLALLFSPQLASEGTSDGCVVAAPPSFVKEKIIDYDFIRTLQLTSSAGHLEAVRLTKDGHYFSAILSNPTETLEITPASRKDQPRKAKVVANEAWKFVYREDFPYGQRVVHWISLRPSGKSTVLEYDRRWKGSFVMLVLRKVGLFQEGIVVGGGGGGLEGVRRALNEAAEEGI